MLKVGATGCAQMATAAHLAGRPLSVLRRREDVHILGRHKLDLAFLVLERYPLVIRAVTDQTIDVGQIILGWGKIRLGSQSCVAISATTWLRR